MKAIEYKLSIKNKDYYNDIFTILSETDKDFSPPISAKDTLENISVKYSRLAHVILAYVDREPAGFVSFYPNFPEDSYLSLIGVKSEFRGLQIGKNLEINCINFCKKYKSKGLLLNMRKSNSKLYESRLKLGYKVIKEYKLEYSDELIVDMHIKFENE